MQCEYVNLMVSSTTKLCRPFERDSHIQYAQLFVLKAIALTEETTSTAEEQRIVLRNIVRTFVSSVNKFGRETDLFSETGWMFDFVDKEVGRGTDGK